MHASKLLTSTIQSLEDAVSQEGVLIVSLLARQHHHDLIVFVHGHPRGGKIVGKIRIKESWDSFKRKEGCKRDKPSLRIHYLLARSVYP